MRAARARVPPDDFDKGTRKYFTAELKRRIEINGKMSITLCVMCVLCREARSLGIFYIFSRQFHAVVSISSCLEATRRAWSSDLFSHLNIDAAPCADLHKQAGFSSSLYDTPHSYVYILVHVRVYACPDIILFNTNTSTNT